MQSSGSNTNASTHKTFQPHNVSVQSKKCSWQEHCSKTAPSEVHCSGGSVYMHMYVLYSEYLTCMYKYLCEKVQNTMCFIYTSCSYIQVLLPQYINFIVWPCAVESLLMFSIAATSEIWNVNHFCREPSVKPQHRQNGILSRNRTVSYGWMMRHCTSSTTHCPAGTQQSLGTEHLWTARPQSDVRAVRTGLLQPNVATVCYWLTATVAMTVTASVGEWLSCDQDWRCQVFCPPDMWLAVCTFQTVQC